MLTRREEREQAFILLFEKSFNPETEISELYETAVENEIISESEFSKTLADRMDAELFFEKRSENGTNICAFTLKLLKADEI